MGTPFSAIVQKGGSARHKILVSRARVRHKASPW